jgi:hypothetical protein
VSDTSQGEAGSAQHILHLRGPRRRARRRRDLVAAVRGVLYERCLPLATSDLEFTTTVTGRDAGLPGAGLTALRHNLPTAPVPQEESASA